MNASQRDKLKEKYQKRVDVLEAQKAEFDEKASMLKKLDVYEKPYFLWHLYFKHVFDAGGFDIVIANPPYGVKVDDELYAESGLGSKDSYGFFIKLAIETLLKLEGTLVYISIKSFGFVYFAKKVLLCVFLFLFFQQQGNTFK